MKHVIEYLKQRRNALILRIKAGEPTLVSEKVETERAITWLTKISEFSLEKANDYDFIILPDMQTGYSEYHLMNDCESGDIHDWVELKNEAGFPVTLTPGDILLSHRPG